MHACTHTFMHTHTHTNVCTFTHIHTHLSSQTHTFNFVMSLIQLDDLEVNANERKRLFTGIS